MAGEKTEKATPKRRDEARKKGQVARSADINGAVVLLVGLSVIALTGGRIVAEMEEVLRTSLTAGADPAAVNRENVGALLLGAGRSLAIAVAPIAFACALAGFVASVAQVKWKPSAQALKPQFAKLNPLKGLKQLLGPQTLFEAVKNVAKVAAVGVIAALAVLPSLPELAALVGLGPAGLGVHLTDLILGVAFRAAAAYAVIAAVDFLYQRHRHEKQLKMDKQEVTDEGKQQSLPAEVKGAIRRRQVQAARARMMGAVPEADVVVTNPTHYAVALSYDSGKLAPEVVAKGQDLIAAQIRRIAEQHDVPVVPNPPLARALHASVEVGHPIPEEMYAAVAQLLAFVYRAAGRRAA